MFHCLGNVGSWMGNKVALSTANIAINTACEIGKCSPELTAALNLPFRIMSMLSQKETPITSRYLETFAFAALFFPYGRHISIGIDLAAICFSYFVPAAYQDKPSAAEIFPEKEGGRVDISETKRRFDYRILDAARHLASNRQMDDRDAIRSSLIKASGKWILFDSLRESRVFLKESLATMPQVVKVADKMILDQTIKRTTEQIQTLVKRLPIFGLAVGSLLAIHRISRGQFGRGVGEVASGIAGCFPGYGTVISLGLDAVLCGLDVRDARNDHLLSQKSVDVLLEKIPLNIPAAYRILGFGSNVHPKREELQTAHNRLYVIVSKDDMQNLARIASEKVDEGNVAEKEDHQRREAFYTQGMQRGFLVLQKIQRLLGLEEFVPEVQ